MSAYKRRVDTLKALVAGSVIGTHSAENTLIEEEFDEAGSTMRVPQLRRRKLLQVLHTTRALDSALKCFLTHHGIPLGGRSLGSYLTGLKNNAGHTTLSPLLEVSRLRYQTNIADPRNQYMHQAGAYPNTDGDIMTLVSEMHACLTEVLAL